MASKRSRKAKKKERKKKKHTPPPVLLEQGRQRLDAGDGRGALDLLKQAQGANHNLEGLPFLLFSAYMLRARQLADKGMPKEAATVGQLAAQHQSAIDPQTLTEAELIRYFQYLNGLDAFQVYCQYVPRDKSIPPIEQRLANVLMTQHCWPELDNLNADHPLRLGAQCAKQALEAMDAGQWQRADQLLRALGRRSPYTPWRLFCKGMLCFGAEDNHGLQQVLDRLPTDFPLAHTINQWRQLCNPFGATTTIPPKLRQALGTETAAGAVLANELRQALRQRRWRDIERLLPPLAEALYPEDPLQARILLLQIVGLAVPQTGLSIDKVHILIQRLLPPPRRPALSAQISLLVQQLSPDLWDVAPAAAYLDQVPTEFPTDQSRSLVQGLVLEALARTGHQAGVLSYYLPPQSMATLASIIGHQLDDPDMLFIELMTASLEADPGNRAGYPFLLDLLRGRTGNNPHIEKVLNDMAARFPDDPKPFLELATYYYSKNAYRKAESALAEAHQRAPYDERILDLQAISHLRSADQSRKRGRFELAAADLERTQSLNRPMVAPLLAVKHLLFEMVSSGLEGIVPRLEALPPGTQLRSLAVLLHDLEENSNVKNVHPAMIEGLNQVLDDKAPLIEQLTGSEVLEVLAPLPLDCAILFEDLHVAPVLATYWPALCQQVDGDTLIALFDILLACGGWDVVRSELNRRLQKLKKSQRDPLLLFYLAVIRYLEGKDFGAKRFEEALDMAGPSGQERLRQAAGRLAHLTHGPLRQALQQFKFEQLNVPLPFFGGDLPPLEDLLNMAEDTGRPDGNPFGGGPEELTFSDDDLLDELDDLEQMIDDNGLRGAPQSMLRDFAGSLRSQPQTRRDLQRIGRLCTEEDLREELSSELETILFPRKRRK